MHTLFHEFYVIFIHNPVKVLYHKQGFAFTKSTISVVTKLYSNVLTSTWANCTKFQTALASSRDHVNILDSKILISYRESQRSSEINAQYCTRLAVLSPTKYLADFYLPIFRRVRCVDSSINANVSQKCTAYILRAEKGDGMFLWKASIHQRVCAVPEPGRTSRSVL